MKNNADNKLSDQSSYITQQIADFKEFEMVLKQLDDLLNETDISFRNTHTAFTLMKYVKEEIYANLNLGTLRRNEGKIDEAIPCYESALKLIPEFSAPYNSLGVYFREKGKFEKAKLCFQKAIYFDQENAGAHWNLSRMLLLHGNLKQGWKEFEWRRKIDMYYQCDLLQPAWDGSDIVGQRLFLQAEQGFGDVIQFIRYAPLISQRGAIVFLECHKELKTLLENIEGIKQVFERGEQVPDFDLHCPLLSLPFIFDTTLESVPIKIPYLAADPFLIKKWRDRLQGDNAKTKVGLVWEGASIYGKDSYSYRSSSLKIFAPLAGLRDTTFYSLQKGKAANQTKRPPQNMRIFDYTDEIHDFSDTAALIHNLDLVISIDTAVAHLTGALGKPVWTLLPFLPDWRWMLHREDSPWYPTMRLFRQPSPGDWGPVIAKIGDHLLELLGRRDGKEDRLLY